MRISELPLTTNPTSTDDLPIDRSGVTYRVKYEALRGPKGDPGDNGTIENLNAAATTLAPGSQATATYENNLLTLGIPQGAKGDPGDDGVGIPSGGTTGQVLKKASATDYDVEWGNATGGVWGSITGTLSDQTDLQNALNAKVNTSALLNLVYPVGSIYLSTNSANPSTLFGGTWEAYAAGRVLVGVDANDTDFDTAGNTGGEKTHTLTIAEMPRHRHTLYSYGGSIEDGTEWSVRPYRNRKEDQILGTACKASGDSQAHNNLQPYITCYIWRRTA